jgi:hypothetical protein
MAGKAKSTPRRQALRAECRARGEKRKALSRITVQAAEARNADRRAHGEPTPWEAARLARVARRAQLRAARARKAS